ncbi:glycerate kinase [Herbiconiux sp. 11R-BC]|uniref:glycerate kinase n=1 Tax=Herbiconiux sp. 11R-BC TaxID=3111637 RepID=UPI003C02B558
MSRRVVIAPDSFKGSASAAQAAAAIAAGWREVHPGDEVVCVPLADGGEGTLDAFEAAHPAAERMPVLVTGPDDRVVEAYWLLLPAAPGTGEGAGRTAVVELANTSGITLLHPLRPLEAHTLGFGQAVRAALDHGVGRLVLALGGSSSSDGGAGLLTALGARFVDASGASVAPGNGGLAHVVAADVSGLTSVPAGGAVVLSDVTNPLLGPDGAVAVFGAQKGVERALAPVAEANLARFARLMTEAFGTDPETPGAGAAGGTGFALLAWGAELVAGSAAIGAELGLPGIVAGADLVITGEGRYDDQSEDGKVPGYVRGVAEAAGASTALVAGAIARPPVLFGASVSLTELAGSSESARGDAPRWLREAGRRLASG